MSKEEEHAAIGKLAQERSDLRRRNAAIASEIAGMASMMSLASHYLDFRHTNAGADASMGLSILESMIAKGGLQQLRVWLTERNDTADKLAQVEALLKEAGVD